MNKKIACLAFIQLVAVLSFLKGFFPLKTGNVGVANFEQQNALKIRDFGEENAEIKDCLLEKLSEKPAFNRLVLIVIDALRADFLLAENSHMTFTRALIGRGEALAFRAQTQAPTVTMPRIKAFTAGTVPSFIDVILNFASSEFSEDNIISQFRRENRKIVFYGDDTWLKLFPGHFEPRSEGTTSFFVADYTEVDDNVTRHISYEMKNSQNWDVMILHYLGLDHIGHSFGPRSQLMPQKFAEMDKIIQEIYTSLAKENRDFLMVILGDHGMSETGSHGGATVSETNVPLAFLSPKFQNGALKEIVPIQQIDLVPTLASLYGLPVPQNNLGVTVTEVLQGLQFDCNRILLSAHRNAMQIFELYVKNKGENDAIRDQFLSLTEVHKTFLKSLCHKQQPKISCQDLQTKYANFMEKLRSELIFSFTEYDEPLLYFGMVLSALVSLCLILDLSRDFAKIRSSMAHFMVFGTLIHAVSYASSSFIEEEHQIWYFLWTSLVILALFQNLNSESEKRDILNFMVILVLHRILRAFNQTGNKWAHLDDLNDFLNLPENVTLRSLLIIAGLICVFACVQRKRSRDSGIFGFCLALVAYFHWKTGAVNLPWPCAQSNRAVIQAQIGYILSFIASFITGSKSHCLVILTLLLIKASNIPVISCLILMHKLWDKCISSENSAIQAATQVWLASAAFFYLGNSNSLGTVDVSTGYIGVDSYRPWISSVLILLHTYAGPFVVAAGARKTWDNASLKIVFLQRALPLTCCLLICFVQRYHLFVWSVFAPKLLYESLSFLVLLCCLLLVKNK